MFRRRLIWNGTPKAPIVDGVPVANVGDIAYKAANGSIKVIALDEWDTSLGTPIGVVVIPSGFAPDNGKARIMGLYCCDSTGAPANATYLAWGPDATDTPLTNYNKVPTTDNAGLTTTGSNWFGYLPSDKYSGDVSYVDGLAKYDDYSYSVPFIPSPYLVVGGVELPNPAYYEPIMSNGINVNAMSDFDGLGNTKVLVGLGSNYVAANAAYNYQVEGAEWYLPAMGELGYLMPRFNVINAAITKAGGNINDYLYLSSSTECDKWDIYFLSEGYNYHETSNWYKIYGHHVRPFAQLDF